MMKKLVIALMAIVVTSTAFAASLKVTVANTLGFDRNKEIVSVSMAVVKQKLGDDAKSFIVIDAKGAQVPCQITANKLTLIFPATVKANGSAVYEIKAGTPEKFAVKTFGRFVPERKDDFAWENDRIAFRMYGPKLANENPSNGVDVWLKKTEALIVDKFYYNDLQKGIHYHVDYGEGIDCYKVAHTLGAGGIAPYTDSTLWVQNQYSKWKVIENGPLRTTFQLTYDSVKVGKTWLKEFYAVSIDAGSQLNKAVVSYVGKIPAGMKLAAGLFLHDKKGVSKIDTKAGYIGYGEVATSDAGVPAGRDYVGAVLGSGKMLSGKQQGDHLLAFANYKPGTKFTYYFGAGWSQWGFPNDQAWFDYLRDFSLKLQSPLKVTVK
ncbi:MAG: DUF4861 family protein [Bacteroidota bacterium]|nr:DUF4861 family protein [Bacteroidota bacterium]